MGEPRTRQPRNEPTYRVDITASQGTVVGSNNRVTQRFVGPAPSRPPSTAALLQAVRSASAELRGYRNTVGGIHIDRQEVLEVVQWVQEPDSEGQLAILRDQPGAGKTVALRDFLETLESAGLPVLAVKCDALSGVRDSETLKYRLGLPLPVEDCALQLGNTGLFVLVVDQLDALSLALSRDQALLDLMLATMARLRRATGIRIVASCRTFDLQNDPRLAQIEVDRTFVLKPLTDVQVAPVLQMLGIESTQLLPAHRTLLSIPLHLDIYHQIVSEDQYPTVPEPFHSLQELYEGLWRRRVLAQPPDIPSPAERMVAVSTLVHSMEASRQLTAPIAVLDEHARAATYLESTGFIQREKGNWLFLHQTLFDYCYARTFVTQGNALSEQILNGPQGLFERSQMVQVLAHLRGTNDTIYQRELVALLHADGLRVHLSTLLISWLGSLRNLSPIEVSVGRSLLLPSPKRDMFLRAASGNPEWFDALCGELRRLLDHAVDTHAVDSVTTYLSTIMEERTTAIVNTLRTYLDAGEDWSRRIAFCLSRLEYWHNDDALQLLCEVLRHNDIPNLTAPAFHNLAQSNPAAGCVAIRSYLDQRLDQLHAGRQTLPTRVDPTTIESSWDPFTWLKITLDEFSIRDVVMTAVSNCPENVVQHLLPWFVNAAVSLTSSSDNETYAFDHAFSAGWYGEFITEGAWLANQMVASLKHAARTEPTEFRRLAEGLAIIDSLAVQRVLAHTYLADGKEYASDILNYLRADTRRLRLGEPLENPSYDSSQLCAAAFPHLDGASRTALEDLILGFQPASERRNPKHIGCTQLRFLKAIGSEHLSDRARGRLAELERKFPGLDARPPRGVVGGWVSAPIGEEARAKMSDDDWLSAMRRYDDSTSWGAPREEFLKGGVIELSRAFEEQVKGAPDRFFRLAKRFNQGVSLHYITAVISGLAASSAPPEWTFDLVRNFAPRITGSFRRTVCSALQRLAPAGVPDDLLDLLADWVLHDPDPDADIVDGGSAPGHDPYLNHGINTNRGAATLAVAKCALSRDPPELERAQRVLKRAARDASTAVRVCVVFSLNDMWATDPAGTIDIFRVAAMRNPKLLKSPIVHDFLYRVHKQYFLQIRAYIQTMLQDDDIDTKQAGARLACLAAFTFSEAHDLADQVMHGDAIHRRGAAQVYARNLCDESVEAVCQEHLLKLVNDQDEQVRKYVGQCFQRLDPSNFENVRAFVEQFLSSNSFHSNTTKIVPYLRGLALMEYDLTLRATSMVIDIVGTALTDIQRSTAMVERELAHIPLTVYNHAANPAIQSRALDVFEELLAMGSWTAREALTHWDRR
jgi:hypothetical protein